MSDIDLKKELKNEEEKLAEMLVKYNDLMTVRKQLEQNIVEERGVVSYLKNLIKPKDKPKEDKK